MLTDQELAELVTNCCGVAHQWDSSVNISQDEDGTLHLALLNDESEIDCEMTATPLGSYWTVDNDAEDNERIEDLWELRRKGEDHVAVCILVPIFLVGYMGL